MKVLLIIYVIYALITWIMRRAAKKAAEDIVIGDGSVEAFWILNIIQKVMCVGLVLFTAAVIIVAIISFF